MREDLQKGNQHNKMSRKEELQQVFPTGFFLIWNVLIQVQGIARIPVRWYTTNCRI